jgi:hypothetical protein
VTAGEEQLPWSSLSCSPLLARDMDNGGGRPVTKEVRRTSCRRARGRARWRRSRPVAQMEQLAVAVEEPSRGIFVLTFGLILRTRENRLERAIHRVAM